MEKIDIGKKIKEKFLESNLTINEFSELLNCERTNIYRIFQRKSVDTELLCKISKILEFNFMDYYLKNEKIKNDSLKFSFEFIGNQLIIHKTSEIKVIVKEDIE